MRRWDGFKSFFTKEAGQFLTGLLPEVQYALKMMKMPYTIVDNRQPLNFLRTEINEDFLWCRDHDKPVVLRDYQIDLTNQALKHKRGVIQAVTGAGKTYIMLSLLKCLPPKTHALVLVDTKELVWQNYEEIKKFGFNDVGMFYGEVKEPNYITVCLINSAPKLAEYYPKIKCLLVDEIHSMMAPRNIRLYKQLSKADIRIGFSATPFTFGGKDEIQKFNVKGHIGPVLVTDSVEGGKLTTAVMQERGVLSSDSCVFYVIDKPQRPYDIYGDAVTYGIAQNDHLNQAVAKLVNTKLKGRTLLVVDRIEHGERLMQLIPGAFWLHGNQKKNIRTETVENLKHFEGDFVGIAIDKIVNKGLNVFIHNLVNCAGGKADHLVIQRMGRGLRTADDKEGLTYIDFYFKINPYLEKHSKERMRILEKEGHVIEIKESFDF
jgi:superfamily II DNA or RNA helicase